jgi:cytochrome P450
MPEPQIEWANEKPGAPTVSLTPIRRKRSRNSWLAAVRGDFFAIIPPDAFDRDCLELRAFSQRFLLLNDPADVQYVLHDNAERYARSPLLQRVFRRTLGEFLVTTEGDAWRNHRHVLAPPFTPRSIRRQATSITEATADLVTSWTNLPDGAALDLVAVIRRLAITIVCRIMFSTDAPDVVALVQESVPGYVRSMRPGLLDLAAQWVPSIPTGRPRRAVPAMEAAVERILTQRRSSVPADADLLSHLLAAVENGAMSMAAVRDDIAHVLIAGHETTEQTLVWAWYLLSLHPSVEATLHAELDRVLAGRRPQFEDIARLPYTRTVIEETMRLCPPVHTLMRKALTDDEISGRRVRKGTEVLIMPLILHHHHRLWREPERFDPERFTPDQVKARHPFSYIPFGGGPRICLGANIAMVEAILILAGVSQHFRLRPAPGQRVEPATSVSLRPRYGMTMMLQRRGTGDRVCGDRANGHGASDKATDRSAD